MCVGTPDPPKRPEPQRPRNNPLLIGDAEEDMRIQDSQRRGTQGLQIALNTAGQQSGLSL